MFSKMFPISKKSKKKFFLTPLGKSKNFKNIKIFNNIGSHDGLKKKLPKSAKMPLITLFLLHPVFSDDSFHALQSSGSKLNCCFSIDSLLSHNRYYWSRERHSISSFFPFIFDNFFIINVGLERFICTTCKQTY